MTGFDWYRSQGEMAPGPKRTNFRNPRLDSSVSMLLWTPLSAGDTGKLPTNTGHNFINYAKNISIQYVSVNMGN